MSTRHTQRGMSLIEVMVAAVIFTLGSLGLISLMFVSAQANRTSIGVMTGNALAKSKLEELTHVDWATMASGNDAKNLDSQGRLTASDYESRDGTYARSWTVTDDPSGLPLRIIAVTVRWFDRQAGGDTGKGAWRSVSMSGGVLRP